MHIDNLTARTRERYLDYLRLREEGIDNVFIESAAESLEFDLMREIGREAEELLYRLFSPAPDEEPRSRLGKACELGRLLRDERLGRPTCLYG